MVAAGEAISRTSGNAPKSKVCPLSPIPPHASSTRAQKKYNYFGSPDVIEIKRKKRIIDEEWYD